MPFSHYEEFSLFWIYIDTMIPVTVKCYLLLVSSRVALSVAIVIDSCETSQ